MEKQRLSHLPKLGDVLSIDQAMELAMIEAQKGLGYVEPNPLVGCVILSSDHRLLSVGYHARVGGDHAEIAALKEVSDPRVLEKAKMIVTLEPCAHEGRTPSCAKHLSQLPLGEVIYGLQDPNPLVLGKGHEIIEKAGIPVRHYGRLQEELKTLIEVFITNVQEKRAFFSLKAAMSLDAQVCLESGESQWITGELARLEGHRLRGAHSAMMVGRKTVEQDNPRLNVRHSNFPDKENKVVLLDPELKLLSQLESKQLWQVHSPKNIFLIADPAFKNMASSKKAIDDLGVNILYCSRTDQGLFRTKELLEKSLQAGLSSILMEVGPNQLAHQLKQQMFDRIYIFQNMSFLGKGRSVTENLHIKSLNERYSLRLQQVTQLDQDLILNLLGPAHFLFSEDQVLFER